MKKDKDWLEKGLNRKPAPTEVIISMIKTKVDFLDGRLLSIQSEQSEKFSKSSH